MPYQPTVTNNFTSADNLKIVWHKWNNTAVLNDTTAKAIVVISHGFGEHSLRYDHVAQHLNQNGYIVYALDYRGHGSSAGAKAQIKHVGDYQPELAQLIDLAKTDYPDLPCFLFGHSMGGAVALGYAYENQAKLKGLLLSAPYLRNAAPVSPLLVSVAKIVANIAPNLGTQAVDAKAISRNPEEVKAYVEDPLVYSGKVKAAMGNALLGIGPEMLSKASQLSLPMLIMHGGADAIADCEGSKELFETVSCADKELKLYPESYHEIVNDYDVEQVLQDMTGWLEQHL